MNKELIEKMITSTIEEMCPELVYENPLLDAKVSSALSKSFVKMLNVTDSHNNVNNNARHSLLQNLRKLCTVEPDDHMSVDDNVTEMLSEFYTKQNEQKSMTGSSLKKELDTFLTRKLISLEMNSRYKSSTNPDVAQAIINLNQSGVRLDNIAKDIILWNSDDKKCKNVVTDLWTKENLMDTDSSQLIDDLAFKMKPQVEIELLTLCYTVLNDKDTNLESLLNTDFMINLIKKCSVSPGCFQMCTSILNFVFIMTNFDNKIQILISSFVKNVKSINLHLSFSILYPTHLRHLVVLLDIDPEILFEQDKNAYSEQAIKYLSILHKESENDLVLLLSHFCQWFDVYFNYVDRLIIG